MRTTFRKSSRPLHIRFLLTGTVIFLLLAVFTVASWGLAFVFTVFTVGSYTLILYFKDYHRRFIAVDERGIEQAFDSYRLRIGWDEVAGLRTDETDILRRKGTVRIKYAAVFDFHGRQIAFSDLGLIGGQPILMNMAGGNIISDISHPELLLAICAKKTDNEELLAQMSRSEDDAHFAADEPQAEPAAGPGKEAAAGKDRLRSLNVAGIFVLVGKVGGTLLKGLGGMFKVVKPGFAVASGAVYGLLFSWKFALALMLMLFVHEYGHVFAMKRSGLKVRGIYFIPFLGAAAVTDDSWKSRAQQAYIALNGPLWGLLLTAVPFTLFLVMDGGGSEASLLAGVAAWWALINLFNLLPINPLDGGRVLSSLSYSVSGRLAKTVSFLAFVACLGLAYFLEIYLFAILGILGLIEFISELEVGRRAKQLEMAGGVENIRPEALVRLKSLARPMFRASDEEKLKKIETGRIKMLHVMAGIKPMKGRAAIRWAAAYILLTAALVGIVMVLASRPEAAFIMQILQ